MERRRIGPGTATGMPAIAAAAVLAGVTVLAGCASGQTMTKGPSVQPTHATVTALPRPSCGGSVTHDLGATTRILSAGKGTLNCFHAAARDCKTASIGVTEMGVDTGVNHVFAIEPGGKGCAVTELTQQYSANFGGSHGKVVSAPCSVAAVSGGGVTLACAGAKLLIPATVTRL
jgi:hypothetical protein